MVLTRLATSLKSVSPWEVRQCNECSKDDDDDEWVQYPSDPNHHNSTDMHPAALGTTGTTLYDNYADPRYLDASPKPTDRMPPLVPAYAEQVLARELYR
jgi:hypothetical protein